MLRYAGYDIVFREIPDEVTLAVNLAGCPNRCPGCHTPALQRDEGEELTPDLLDELLKRYAGGATCLCFMGGDADSRALAGLAARVRRAGLRVGWYSGCSELPPKLDPAAFDYIKLGPYVQALGGLDSPRTNQRLYRIDRQGERGVRLVDITSRMRPQQ